MRSEPRHLIRPRWGRVNTRAAKKWGMRNMPAQGCTCTHTHTLLTYVEYSNVINLSGWEGCTGNNAPTVRSARATRREAFQQKQSVIVICYAPRHDKQGGFRVWLHVEDPFASNPPGEFCLSRLPAQLFAPELKLQLQQKQTEAEATLKRSAPEVSLTSVFLYLLFLALWQVSGGWEAVLAGAHLLEGLAAAASCRPGLGEAACRSLLKKKKEKKRWLVGDVYWPPGAKQKVWRYNRGSCSSKPYDMWEVYFTLIDCDNHNGNICLFLLHKERRRRPLPAPIKKQKAKWKFILIEFPHRKLGSHAVRLEKHGTMPRSSTLFFSLSSTHICALSYRWGLYSDPSGDTINTFYECIAFQMKQDSFKIFKIWFVAWMLQCPQINIWRINGNRVKPHRT